MHEAQQTNEMPIDDRLAQPAPLLPQIPSGKQQSSGGTTPKSLFFEGTATTTTPAGDWSESGSLEVFMSPRPATAQAVFIKQRG